MTQAKKRRIALKQVDHATSTKRTPVQLRQEFKESYYVMGDKTVGLKMMSDDLTPSPAKSELDAIIEALQIAQQRLAQWGDTNLPMWD